MNILDVQRALFRLEFDPHGCDGIDGPHTRAALDAFIAARGIDRGAAVPKLAEELAGLPLYIQAAHCNAASRPHSAPIDLVVIHTMEAPEKPDKARQVAEWFAGPMAPEASAHWCFDSTEEIQCVLECDVAWGAPGANARGVHLEHTGYASQTPEQWADDYSNAVLAISAKRAAILVRRFSIPIQHLEVGELAAGGRGFVGHVDCSNAFESGKGHRDPGQDFPWPRYLDLVRSFM